MDYLYIAGAIIISLGGSSVLILGVSGWLGKVWASRILEKDKLKYQSELEKIKSELSLHMELFKAAGLKYSESQFHLYNDLWRSLCSLKAAGNDLWFAATQSNLRRFAKELAQTGRKVEESLLFIEDHHYLELSALFDEFKAFRFGKGHLMDIRSRQRADEYGMSNEEIEYTINQNREIRERYSNLISSIGKEFKAQVRGDNAQPVASSDRGETPPPGS